MKPVIFRKSRLPVMFIDSQNSSVTPDPAEGTVFTQDAIQIMRRYQAFAQAHGIEELEKARRQLRNGKPASDVVEMLTRNLVRKIIHKPCVNLRSEAASGQSCLPASLRILFDIPDGGR
jgi:glutamyl-tRNA reductase